jgi:hypothetical protein
VILIISPIGSGEEKASDTILSMVAGVCPARSNVSDSVEKSPVGYRLAGKIER